MELIFVKDYDEMSKKGYEIVKEVIEKKENPVISLNSGGSPKGLFKFLVDGINKGLDISNTSILVLDEFIGPRDDVYTVRTFMYERLFNLIDTKPKNLFLMDGGTEDVSEEINRYTKILKEYPRDLQLLGLGTNGHIGGNEPGTPFDSTMFFVESTETTIQATTEGYGLERKDAPTTALTLGLLEIIDAEKVLLLVSGKHKAKAVKEFLEGDITPDCPVTILRKCENATVIIDEEAASLLKKVKINKQEF